MGFLDELPDNLKIGIGTVLGALTAAASVKSGGVQNYMYNRSRMLDDPQFREQMGPLQSGMMFVGGSHVPTYDTTAEGPTVPTGKSEFVPNLNPLSSTRQLAQANQESLLSARTAAQQADEEYAQMMAAGMHHQFQGGVPVGAPQFTGGGGGGNWNPPQAILRGTLPTMSAPVGQPQALPGPAPVNAAAGTPAGAPTTSPQGFDWSALPEDVTSLTRHGIGITRPQGLLVPSGTKDIHGKPVHTGSPLPGHHIAIEKPAADTGQIAAQIKRLDGAMSIFDSLFTQELHDTKGNPAGLARDILPQGNLGGAAYSYAMPIELAVRRKTGDVRAQAFQSGAAQAIDFARAVGGAARMNEVEIRKLEAAFVPTGTETQPEFDNKILLTKQAMAALRQGLAEHGKDASTWTEDQPNVVKNLANQIIGQLNPQGTLYSAEETPTAAPANAPTAAGPLAPAEVDHIELGPGVHLGLTPIK